MQAPPAPPSSPPATIPPPYPVDDPQRGGSNPSGMAGISMEERLILRDCQREAFYKRSLPLAFIAGAGTMLAVKRGVISTPTGMFSFYPRVFAASTVGYFAGKFSYMSACREKFLRDAPNSNIAKTIRSRMNLPPPPDQELPEDEEQAFGGGNDMSNTQGDAAYSDYFEAEKGAGARSPAAAAGTQSYENLRRLHRERHAGGRGEAAPPPAVPSFGGGKL